MSVTIFPKFSRSDSAADVRDAIGVYSTTEVDNLLSALGALTSEDIDTLAEINNILTDANLASIAYVDGLASNYATAAQGALADSALQPSDITSGTITAGTGDIDFDALGGAESPLTLTASSATEVPLTVQGAASQTAKLQEWKDSSGTVVASINGTGGLVCSRSALMSDGVGIQVNTLHTVIRAQWGASGSARNLIHSPFNATGTLDNGLAQHANERRTIVFANASAGTPKVSISAKATAGMEYVAEFDNDSTAGNTRMLLWDVDTGSLVRVSVGADDSGGTGYKVLRIPN